MWQLVRPAVVLLVAFTVLTGVIYPAVVTGIAQLIFPHQANGSLIVHGDKAVGSELIGQSFIQPEYFWGRLSATSPPYNAAASSGSNRGPLNPGLVEDAKARIDALKQAGSPDRDVPVDLATASASGLDPQISLAAAEYQVPRVAAARKLKADQVREVVRQHTASRQLGILGEPRVNVLQLNLALDELATEVR